MRQQRWRRRVLVLTAVLALLAGACSGGDDSATDGFDAGFGPPTTFPGEFGEGREDADGGDADEPGMEAPVDDMDAAPGSTGSDGALVPVIDTGRSIIYTATLEVVVDDVAAASREAQTAMAGLGALLFGQETTTDPRPATVLVFRVDPADFTEALNRLEGLGEVVTQRVSADDVTERVVDLRSRIATSEVSVERLRALLADADSVEAVAALEGQLLERETNLEVLRGQLRTIEDQVGLATITLVISGVSPRPTLLVTPTIVAGDDGERCPGGDDVTLVDGDDAVLCVSIENTGTTSIVDLQVRDPGLDISPRDVRFLDAEPGDRLAPGETVVAWARFTAERGARSFLEVSGVPVGDGDVILRQPVEISVEPLRLEVLRDDSLPGFVDAVAAGWGTVLRVLGVGLVVVGAAIPLLVLAVPLALLVWFGLRRRSARGATTGEAAPAAPPPPPPPPAG